MKITGIVLAGGKSTRMGSNKAFLNLGGLSLVERVTKVLSLVCKEILIVGDNKDELTSLGYPVIPDTYSDCGPLAGIHAGLKAANNYYSFVTACDTPFIDEKIILKIIEEAGDYDAVIMKHQDYHEPLFSLYSKTFIPIAEKAIKKGNYSITSVLSTARCKPVFFNPDEIPLLEKKIFNINTPEDFKKAKWLDKD